MSAKRCPKCGKFNPLFFTHCVDCGARLPGEGRKVRWITPWIRTIAFLAIVFILIVFVIIPSAHNFHAFGVDLTNKISTESAITDSRLIEYPLNQAVESHGLQITAYSARDGQNTYNSNKFYLIGMNIRNNRSVGNIHVSSNDFELTVSDGSTYYPYGIGSKVMYDLSPAQDTTAELTFIIPQSVTAQKLRYTLPATSSVANDEAVVVFNL